MGVSYILRCDLGCEADSRPECLGLPCAALHTGLMMLFIPFPFSHMFENGSGDRHAFPHTEVGRLLDTALHIARSLWLMLAYSVSLLPPLSPGSDDAWVHR
jgi:hypothetical protein